MADHKAGDALIAGVPGQAPRGLPLGHLQVFMALQAHPVELAQRERLDDLCPRVQLQAQTGRAPFDPWSGTPIKP